MAKDHYDDYVEEQDIPIHNLSEKSPILDDIPKKNNFQSRLRCLILVGLVLLVALVLTLVFWQYYYDFNGYDNELPDPDTQPPPSYLPMGLYKKAAAVSNGGPCSQIAIDVMKKGGNAVDAAIALMLCDGVTCPGYMGVGGGFIMSIYNGTTKKVMAVNARETAPAAATTGMFLNDPNKSMHGGLAIAVPGAFKGYSTIYKLYGGGVPWEALFEPTIRLCEDGIRINKFLERGLEKYENFIKKDPMLKDILINKKTGHAKKSGDYYALLELAKTLKIVAQEGSEAIYNGSLTDQLVEDIKQLDGIITKQDFASYEVEIEESFTVNLKSGYTIHSGSPPGSGIVLAFILRVLDGLLPAPNAGLDMHRIVEAFKFGYGERSHLGDHRFVNVSDLYEKVKSDSYIESIQKKIRDNYTSTDPRHYGADFYVPDDYGTANMAVTDSMGNVVVCTSTINTYLGCGRTSPSTGIIFNNQMNDFSTPGLPNFYKISPSPSNFIKPGKRPMSSTCPTVFTDRNGDFVLGIGAAGGSKITLATSQVSATKLWFNKTIKEAIDKPRIYHQLMPMEVDYEFGVPKDVIKTLRDIGHTVNRIKPFGPNSAATGIARSPTGLLEAIADYRRAGNASGY